MTNKFKMIRNLFIAFNNVNRLTKSNIKPLKAVVVFTEDSFKEKYPLESRSYGFNSDNKIFYDWMLGSSLFGSSLDGSDNDVRLDYYMFDGNWKVENCYLIE